jgi:hypothetical protein
VKCEVQNSLDRYPQYGKDEGKDVPGGAMKRIVHWFLILCGAVLVVLRLYPSDVDWLSKLFFDDIIHDRMQSLSVTIIQALGITGSSAPSYVANLVSLGHVVAVCIQALGIVLTFYIVTRWI